MRALVAILLLCSLVIQQCNSMARSSPLEMLASSVRAIQLAADLQHQQQHIVHTTTEVEDAGDYLSEMPSISRPLNTGASHQPQHVYIPMGEYPEYDDEGSTVVDASPTYLVLPPNWNAANRRRSDADQEGEPSQTRPVMVAWPAGSRLPSRNVPLRFVAAVAVPVSTINEDPILTQRELSEVVYYSSMDLQRLNSTDEEQQSKDISSDDKRFRVISSISKTESPSNVLSITTTTSTSTSTTTKKPTTVTTTTTFKPKVLPHLHGVTSNKSPSYFLPTVVPNIIKSSSAAPSFVSPKTEVNTWNTSSSLEGVWYPRSVSAVSPEAEGMMDGENVAYVVVGICCGLSVLTLVLVMLALRLRGSAAAAVASHRSASDRMVTMGDSLSDLSDDSTSLQLPQRLLNLINTRSQEASTHKLGSWFNGRPTTLSIRHGANMAFPAPLQQFEKRSSSPEMLEVVSDFGPEELEEEEEEDGDDAEEEEEEEQRGEIGDIDSVSAVSNSISDEEGLPRVCSLEPLQECSEVTTDSPDECMSRNDTLIFWSSNSDRLV